MLDQIRQALARATRKFLHSEVGGCQIKMKTRRGADRTDRIVYRESNEMSFTPPGDFFRFGNAGTNCKIYSRKIDQIFFDELTEFPLARIVFPRRDRDAGCRPEPSVGIRVLGTQRILYTTNPQNLVFLRRFSRRNVV